MTHKPDDKPSLFGSLPSYDAAMAEGLPPGAPRRDVPVCGDCEQPCPDARSYTVLYLVFLLVVFLWRTDEVYKCRRCMRDYLLTRLPLALVMASCLAPLVFVWWAVLYVRTFLR